MKLFKNFFVCNNGDEYYEKQIEILENNCRDYENKIQVLDKNYRDLKDEVKLLKKDVNVLFRDNTDIRTDIKNLEIKLDTRFDVLTGKLDSVILLLKK